MPAPEFPVNEHRFDPYKNFKFQVFFVDNSSAPVAGVSRVSALTRSTESIQHREGNSPNQVRLSPGQTTYEAITLERGVTHDLAFEQWANKVWNLGSGLEAEVSLKDFRKDIIIKLLNETGQVVIAYNIFRCWVSQYQALPQLDANANAVAIQSIILEHEGFERDESVTEPSEPSLE